MNDRLPIRDRTLILRILVPGLEARLRDKMRESEERAAEAASTPKGAASSSDAKDIYIDLDGVTCEPTEARNRTLWNFHCDGATYPAKLVNLPCPVELHKTHDHAAYYKSADIAQMLIVYEDDMALEEANAEKPVEGFPTYYHSGLTPPMKRCVEKRFAAREHSAVPPPRSAVSEVETELVELMEKLAKDEKKRSSKVPALTTATKVLEEVEEEVVDYEPWMDDYGQQPSGIEFDSDEQICSLHPQVWLSSQALTEMKEKEKEAQEKKEAKRREKEEKKQQAEKKGIASKKNREVIDDVTLAASTMLSATDGVDLMGDVDLDEFDLDLNDEEMNFDDVDDVDLS